MKLLTKSLFKIGLECPNKLYFQGNPKYANTKKDDPFLEALAQGGFQVEALAKLTYPDGTFIDTENNDIENVKRLTEENFIKKEVVLYEAAFAAGNLFVRTDIVSKKGENVKLIEVKAKSFDSTEKNNFLGSRGGLVSSWKPYLFDLAFQKYVAQKAFPSLKFKAFLMLPDKSKKANVEGLNQLIRIPASGNPRKDVICKIKDISEINGNILCEIDVDDLIDDIIESKYRYFDDLDFESTINLLNDANANSKFLNWPTKFSNCKKCEFKIDPKNFENGKLLSGFEHCLKLQHGWQDEDFKKPSAFSVWNFQGKNLVEENRLLMDQLEERDFNVKVEAGKISTSERRWIQVIKARSKDSLPFVLHEELQRELSTWNFPLHFIDFETSAVALPFSKGRRPYEQIAFQFSHHLYHEDGLIEHRSQFINVDPGIFPNFSFARALKNVLNDDNGTILRFADHENNIVNAIIDQLESSLEDDREELITFLKTISHSTKSSSQHWIGARDMIDLRKIILNFYYNPLTDGSNSLKFILPAALESSDFLKNKYAKPLSEIKITSFNFEKNHKWLEIINGQVVNPYKKLPILFSEWCEEELEKILSDLFGIENGGAALTAYAKLQFSDMKENERGELRKGLLKYCELDTLAMVMIYEHLKYDFILK